MKKIIIMFLILIFVCFPLFAEEQYNHDEYIERINSVWYEEKLKIAEHEKYLNLQEINKSLQGINKSLKSIDLTHKIFLGLIITGITVSTIIFLTSANNI
jgi:hypothetical protein